MGMDHLLPAFCDEMAKIAVSVKGSAFRQTRIGRRPIRAATLLKKETSFKQPDAAPIKDHESGSHEGSSADHESEAGSGLQGAEE